MDPFRNWLLSRIAKGKILKIPEGKKELRSFAYRNRKDIIGIEFPKTLEIINKECFCGCKNLREVNIPANVRVVSKNAFAKCTKLEKITFSTLTDNISYDALGGEKNNFKFIYIAFDGKSISITSSKDKDLEENSIKLEYNIQNFKKSIDENFIKSLGIKIDESAYKKLNYKKDKALDEYIEKNNDKSLEL